MSVTATALTAYLEFQKKPLEPPAPLKDGLISCCILMMIMMMVMIGDEMGLVVMIVVQRDDSLVVKPKINI